MFFRNLIERIGNQKMNMVVFSGVLILIFIYTLSTCIGPKGSILILEDGQGTGFTMDLKEYNSKNKCELSLNKDEVLQIEITRKIGEINLMVKGENGSEPYMGNNLKSGMFTVKVSEADTYVFHVFGKYATGRVTVKVRESLMHNDNQEKEVGNTPNNNEISLECDKELRKSNYHRISAFMEAESRNAFSPYYDILDFQISDYKEEMSDRNVVAEFLYKIVIKNYIKDPDTVEYIKEAKESKNDNYQQMYDEYLLPKEMNFHLKVVIEKSGLITLYSNTAPKGVEWEETKMTDYIQTK